MARAQSYLWGSGGTLILISLTLTRAPGTFVPGMVGVAVLALLVATVLWSGQRWLPPVLLSPTVALGSTVITLLMWFDGAPSSVYSLFYVWAALYAFYFFSRGSAALHGVIIAVLAAAEMALREPAHPPAGRWLIIVGTVIVAGVWTQHLVRQVRWLVRVDSLTHVANRRHLDAELPGMLVASLRSDRPVTVISLDLDHFKAYNDELGHQAGDQHLRQTAAAWEAQLRPEDLLARNGGEEFVAVLPDCDADAARAVAERMRQATPNGQTCSVGMATWDRLETPTEALGRADAAIYEAKAAGRNRAVAALSHPAGGLLLPRDWAATIADAMRPGHVRSAFQPIVRMDGGGIHGLEALARPVALPAGAAVDDFFAAAQRSGAMRDMDWVCRRAALEGATSFPADQAIFVNVALGALLSPLHDVDQMLLLLRSVNRSAATVVLEITEREAVADTARLLEVIASYRAFDFRFAIDDVGEGHSTIELLAGCCADYIKLARSVTSSLDMVGSRAAVRAVVAFAHESDGRVIAEGIETVAQADQLRELGVEMGQGFLFARPGWPEDLVAGAPTSEGAVELRVLPVCNGTAAVV